MKKAWRTIWGGMPEGIVAADTRGQAAAITMRAVREYIDPKATYKGLYVRRAPEHDAWAELDSTGVGWHESLLPKPPS